MSEKQIPDLLGNRRVRPVFLWLPRRLSGELRLFGWHRVCQEYKLVSKEAIWFEDEHQSSTVLLPKWVDLQWYKPDDAWGYEVYQDGR